MDIVQTREAISQLRHEVRNFSESRGGKSWGFSCLVCGDSSTDPRKARFGVTFKDGNAVCHCFNCSYSNTFANYLSVYHKEIYQRINHNRFFDDNALFSHDGIINDLRDSEEILTKIFFIDRYNNIGDWINLLKRKKIVINKQNFDYLYSIFKTKNM